MKTLSTAPLRLVGVTCRTTHADASRDVGSLWHRASQQGLHAGEPAFSAYYDYDLDEGAYSVMVGRALAAGEPVPDGLDVLEVPGQECLVEQLPADPAAVGGWWGGLWGRWPNGGPRRFAVDLERWTGQGPGHHVEVRVGVDPMLLEV